MTTRLAPLDYRIPNWDTSQIIARDCPLCDGSNNPTRAQRPDGLTVRNCNHCQLFYVSPAPSMAALAHFYQSYHRAFFDDTTLTASGLLTDLKMRDPYDDIRIQALASHLSLDGARVLDIGCGKGAFLFQLKRLGALTQGIEIDHLAVDFARAIGIEDVHCGYLENFESDLRFDVVTMLDVLEHPLNPSELVERAVQLLKPGGLLMVWTPNGARPWVDPLQITFRVDLEHMQYFGPKNLVFLAARFNLEILHLETLGYPSLADLITPRTRKRSINIKTLAKRLPYFAMLKTIRDRWRRPPSLRRGNYHLLGILRSSTSSLISESIKNSENPL